MAISNSEAQIVHMETETDTQFCNPVTKWQAYALNSFKTPLQKRSPRMRLQSPILSSTSTRHSSTWFPLVSYGIAPVMRVAGIHAERSKIKCMCNFFSLCTRGESFWWPNNSRCISLVHDGKAKSLKHFTWICGLMNDSTNNVRDHGSTLLPQSCEQVQSQEIDQRRRLQVASVAWYSVPSLPMRKVCETKQNRSISSSMHCDCDWSTVWQC